MIAGIIRDDCTLMSVSRRAEVLRVAGSVAEADAYLTVEGAPGLLETEVIVEIFIRKIAALHREVVTTVLQAVAQRKIVGKLVGHNVVAAASDHFGIIGERMCPLVVVGQCQHIPLSTQVVPIEVSVKVGKAVSYTHLTLPTKLEV